MQEELTEFQINKIAELIIKITAPGAPNQHAFIKWKTVWVKSAVA